MVCKTCAKQHAALSSRSKSDRQELAFEWVNCIWEDLTGAMLKKQHWKSTTLRSLLRFCGQGWPWTLGKLWMPTFKYSALVAFWPSGTRYSPLEKPQNNHQKASFWIGNDQSHRYIWKGWCRYINSPREKSSKEPQRGSVKTKIALRLHANFGSQPIKTTGVLNIES